MQVLTHIFRLMLVRVKLILDIIMFQRHDVKKKNQKNNNLMLSENIWNSMLYFSSESELLNV